MSGNTYDCDLEFLKKHANVVELAGPGDARLAVVPAWQGRVMTSTLAGGGGASFGWVNRNFIESGRDDAAFNNYGGEDRFWLGPEAGQFGLWFTKGQTFDLANWKTPRGLNTGRFSVTSQGKKSVAMTTHFSVSNYSETVFQCAVRRRVRMLGMDHAAEHLACPTPAGVNMVGFETSNTLANVGETPWTRRGGLLSIWILGMFKPLARGRVVIPFIPGDAATLGPAATTDYFGPLPPERCRLTSDCLYFACDGKSRGKVGISPARARNVLGSYDPDAGVLTIVQFNLPGGAGRLPWVNSLWQLQDAPFAGDAVNSYNDGEAFYELETSSPAAELPSGGTTTHVHRTFHFAGPAEALHDIALRVLGAELSGI